MKKLYTFDDKEVAFLKPVRDALAQNQIELKRRLKNISEINGLSGELTEAPDSSGFLAPNTEAPAIPPDPRGTQTFDATAL
jgi:hypothetical protein